MITPKRAHDFAKVLLKRAKTDTVDAATLAELGALLRPARWTPPVYTELAQRLAEREAVVRMRQQVGNPHPALEERIATLDA